MPEYIYRAIDDHGIMLKHKVQEKSKQNLVKKLKANGLTPIDVRQTSFGKSKKTKKTTQNRDISELVKLANENDRSATARKRSTKERLAMKLTQTEKITTRDIIVFTQNFYLLKKAGFNNVHALSTLSKSCENFALQDILDEILTGVEAGDYMYTTMELYSDIFPYIYINLVKVGELSGSLEESLKQAVEYMETSTELNKKIKKILIPNIAQFVFLLVVLIVGSLVLIPTIQNVFDQLGSTDQLPWYTMMFSHFLQQVQKVWYIPILIIAGIIGAIYARIQTPEGRYKWDDFKYHMPIFGSLFFAIDFSRISKAMLLNLKNGMRIQEALEVSKNVVKNYVMLSIIESSINNIIIGKSWVEPFEQSGLPSAMVTEMLKIGMQTDLAEMMDKMVEYMDMDINVILQRIVTILPQILYSIVGILLIFVTLVVLVPCIQVYMGTFLFSAAGM